MAKGRSIVIHPDPVLRLKARPVERIDASVLELVEDMRRVMAELEGAGIAAPQLGESVRIFLTSAREGEPERVFINPVLEEGCLSLPDIRAEILRPRVAKIRAMGLDGSEFSLESDGFPARVWQHEFDHLEGVLIIDRMRPIDRLANRRALRSLERAGG